MSLRDTNLKKEYRTPKDNIVTDFYIPLLKESILYKRSVGYFSSSALFEISYGINSLIKNEGKIQLIASPHLSVEDIDAIDKGYEVRNNIIEKALLNAIEEPKNYFENQRLNILATLIAQEKLDIKIAIALKNRKMGLYHEKLGLIYDSNNNIVAFSGSMNETSNAFNNNYETIDIFTSWEDAERIEIKESAFNILWDNMDSNIETLDFPDAVKEKILSYKKDDVDWEVDEKEFQKQNEESTLSDKLTHVSNYPKVPDNISFYDYQKKAINNWKANNYQGIFDMATGTGKTYTGLGAITQLYNDLNGRVAVIIVCPYQHLVDQWVEDINNFNIDPIIGHSSSIQKDFKKKLKLAIMDYNLGIKNFFCFVSTNSTFASNYIQSQINNIHGNVLLLVDEAHNFGANNLKKTLTPKFNYRLALSATIERYNDEEGTNVLLNYFGKKCIEFSLEEAIDKKFLTPYKYYPVIVYLTEGELREYHVLSREIAKCIIKKNNVTKLSEQGKIIAQQRSRLVAGAVNKKAKLSEVIEPYKNDNHMLVYCGATKISEKDNSDYDVRQIEAITKMLGMEKNMHVSQFTSRESINTRNILKEKFSSGNYLQALVAIKCLDEGVNIPAIKTAFILASTTNKKEYIQRRGRVLRKYPGKEYAEIYDFITLPRSLNVTQNLSLEEIQCEKTLAKNEVNRIKEFTSLALNKREAMQLRYDIISTYKLDEDYQLENELC